MTRKIKIDTSEHVSPLHERAFRKKELKVDKTKMFMDPIIELTNEQFERFEEMTDFCRTFNRCPQCKRYIPTPNFSSTPDGGIRGLCADCLYYVTDESQQARGFVKWLNKEVLDDYGMDFNDGFPKMMKHEVKGIWCKECKQQHTKMIYIDYRGDEGHMKKMYGD